MKLLLESLAKLVSKAARPGVLGVVGRKIEKQAAKDVGDYFIALGKDIIALNFEILAKTPLGKELVKHQIDMRLGRVLRNHRPLLISAIAINIQEAYLGAWKFDPYAGADTIAPKGRKENGLKEANGQSDDDSSVTLSDELGPSGEAAASYAADYAAQLVTKIDETTRQLIAEAISEGITEQLGVPGTARLVRNLVDDMSVTRAQMIASTEMNSAMSKAALDKMAVLEVEYKQIILSDDACEICVENADADPLPIDESYDSGDLGPPFHPNCRCAITGARPTAADDDN